MNGIFVVAVCGFIGWLLAGWIGLFAATQLALLPVLHWADVALDVTTHQLCLALVLLGIVAADRAADEAKARRWRILAACAAAFGALVRPVQAAFVLPLVVSELRRDRGGRRDWRRAGWTTVPTAIALCVVGVIHAHFFGSPFRSGDDFWFPSGFEAGSGGPLDYVSEGLAMERDFASLLTTFAPITALFALGILTAFWRMYRNRVDAAIVATLALTVPLVSMSSRASAATDVRVLGSFGCLVPIIASYGLVGARSRFARWLKSNADAAVPTAVLVVLLLGLCLTWSASRLTYEAKPIRWHCEPGHHPILQSFDDLANAQLLSPSRFGQPPPDLAIVDFDPSLARRGLPLAKQVMVVDRDRNAPLFARIAAHGLVGVDGRTAHMRALFQNGAIQTDQLEFIDALLRGGGRVVYLETSYPETFRSTFDCVTHRLRDRYSFDSYCLWLQNAGLEMWEVRAR